MNDLVKLQDGPLTKAAIQQAGQGYAEALLEEWALPPLSAYVRLRALRDALDAALAEVEGAAMDAADLNPGETVHGVKVVMRNGASRWDYSHDAAWGEMKASEAAVAEQRKAREKFLQMLPDDMVDPATGEFVSPAVQLTMGNRTIALTFPKE